MSGWNLLPSQLVSPGEWGTGRETGSSLTSLLSSACCTTASFSSGANVQVE